MVRFLTFLFLVGSVAGIVLLDLVLWEEAWQLGVAGIFGLIGFFIGYRLVWNCNI